MAGPPVFSGFSKPSLCVFLSSCVLYGCPCVRLCVRLGVCMCKREEAEASCPVFRGEVEPVSTEAVSDPQPAGCVLTFEVKQNRTNRRKKKKTTTASPPGPVRSVYTDWATVASE